MCQAENLVGEAHFHPLTDDRTTTDLNPQIYFLAFPRELIIRVVGNLEEGREKAPLKPGSFSAVNGKIQFCTRLRQTSQAWPVVIFQLLSVTFVIQTFFDPLFSAVSALIKHSARVCTICVPVRADGECARLLQTLDQRGAFEGL